METLSLLPFPRAVSVDLKQVPFGKCQVMILVKYKILKGAQYEEETGGIGAKGTEPGKPNVEVTGERQVVLEGCLRGRMPEGCLEAKEEW